MTDASLNLFLHCCMICKLNALQALRYWSAASMHTYSITQSRSIQIEISECKVHCELLCTHTTLVAHETYETITITWAQCDIASALTAHTIALLEMHVTPFPCMSRAQLKYYLRLDIQWESHQSHTLTCISITSSFSHSTCSSPPLRHEEHCTLSRCISSLRTQRICNHMQEGILRPNRRRHMLVLSRRQ